MRAAAGLPVLVAAGALLTASLFFGGGSGGGRLLWIGAGAILAALGCLVGDLFGWLPRPVPTRTGLAALGLLALLALWTGLTIAWSITPDRSWAYLNRGLVYLAFALVGLYAAGLLRRPAPVFAAALAVLLGGVILWALAGKVIPGLFPDGARVARLRNPIGYWNALGLACALSLPVYLWLSATRRVVGTLGLYLSFVALLLTYSRGGVVAAVLAIALWLAAGIARRQSISALAVALPAGLAVAGIGLALPGVAKDLQPQAVRVADGAWFGLALALGALLVAWLAGRRLRDRELRLLGVIALALVVVGIGALLARGDWLAGFRGSDEPQVSQNPGRLTSASSNNRWTWWGEAWQLFLEEPVEGKGAASFEIARRPIRDSAVVTTEPHNLALQFLAEAGVVGFLLAATAALAALAAAWEAVRRLEGEDRAAAVALAIVLPVYLLHALADIDWDFVGVTGLLFLIVGVLAGSVSPAVERRSRPALAAAALVAGVSLVALLSLTAPWLADRRVDDAYVAIGRDDPAAAVSTARGAHELNPLSLEPLLVWALADEAGGDRAGALRRFEQRTRLEPSNSDTWYDLGAYEFEIGRYQAAYEDLNHAYTLDPHGPAGRKGGLLDQSRVKVESGAS